MKYVNDIRWKKGMRVSELVDSFHGLGFQSIEVAKAANTIVKMKKASAKIYLTFTANMVTSGLRGFFAQLIRLKMADFIVTTAGSIEEDIMKATGEKFIIGAYNADDVELHEKGTNRVGNLYITNDSYCNFESMMLPMLEELYKKKARWATSELLKEIGLKLKDKDSILYQAARNNVPVYCPGITDGAIGFHLFMFQQKHKDFVVDVVEDFKNILLSSSNDDIKGMIALGGGISKHYAILSCLLNGGLDYALYITTARQESGSMSGATTQEAKSWGKIKDDSDATTVVGDVSVMFPLAMMRALDELAKDGLIKSV